MALPNILYGLHIGEHGFEPERIIREIKENCVASGYRYSDLLT